MDGRSRLTSSAASPHQRLEKFSLSAVDTQPPSPLFSEANYIQIWLLQSSPTDIQEGKLTMNDQTLWEAMVQWAKRNILGIHRADKKSDIIEEANKLPDKVVTKTTDTIHVSIDSGGNPIIDPGWARLDDDDLEAHCKEMSCAHLRAVELPSGSVIYFCAYPNFEPIKRRPWIRRCPGLK